MSLIKFSTYRYVLFRRKWGAKGFGMTLKDPDLDFDIWSFFNGSPESFEPIYGKVKNIKEHLLTCVVLCIFIPLSE